MNRWFRVRAAIPCRAVLAALCITFVAVVAESDGRAEHRWAHELRVWTANDGWADFRDTERRSDEGATASLGFRWIEQFDDNRHGRFDAAYFLFTERGGDLRSDWLRLDARWGQTGVGNSWFDSWLVEAGVGLQATGDLGGAAIQHELHALTISTIDLTFDTGLQQTYSAGLRAAGVLTARGRAERHGGWLLFGLEGDVLLPAGNTGLGWLAASLQVRLGPAKGFYLDVWVRAALQWHLGRAFAFAGAPTDGGVIIPSAAIGWADTFWGVEGLWERNHLGTERGVGSHRDNESVTLSFVRRW